MLNLRAGQDNLKIALVILGKSKKEFSYMASMSDMSDAAWNVCRFAHAICFLNDAFFDPKKRNIGPFKGVEVISSHVKSTNCRGPTQCRYRSFR